MNRNTIMQICTSLSCPPWVILALIVALSSCKDDEPFVKAKLSMNVEALTVSEGAGIIEVGVVLDKGAPSDITIRYTLGGTAISPADYGIVGKDGEVQLAKGEISTTIEIEIADDDFYEGIESIEISLEETNSKDVDTTNDNKLIVTVEDNDPQITASFDITTMTITEGHFVELNVSLSEPVRGSTTIYYAVSGTARDSVSAVAAEPDLPTDYAIQGNHPGQLEIAEGQSEGIIRLFLYSDSEPEDADPGTDYYDPETILISLAQADNGVLISPSDNTMEIKVQQEDGIVIELYWDEGTTIDMDLFLWSGDLGSDVSELTLSAGSYSAATEGPESVFIGNWLLNAACGVTYNYWSGDVTPMNFESHFRYLVNGQPGDPDIYSGSYTLANLNPWSSPNDLVHIEQTFDIVNGIITNVSPISTPSAGSRAAAYQLPKGLKKTD